MKAKRPRVTVGDVFSVNTSRRAKKYFQYIGSDRSMLGSHVIRAFGTTYAIDAVPEMETIIRDPVDFYAHVLISLGIKMGLWIKMGHCSEVGDRNVLFRGTYDYGVKLGEEPVRLSEDWHVWEINGAVRDVGKLEGENRKAEIGVVVTPHDIVERMRTGKYNFVYPDFE